jgi:hypothetical protein
MSNSEIIDLFIPHLTTLQMIVSLVWFSLLVRTGYLIAKESR